MSLLAQTTAEFAQQWGPAGLALAIAIDKLSYWVRRSNASQRAETRLHARLDRFDTAFSSIGRIMDKVHDDSAILRRWHEPDASTGSQSWKNIQMIKVVDGMSGAIDEMSRIMDRLVPVLTKIEGKL